MLLIMREKLNETIQREGRKTVQRQEVDKAQCTLLLARTESDEVYKALATLGKTMAKNLQSFGTLMEEGKAAQANTFEAGCKATVLCNRILDGEVDKEALVDDVARAAPPLLGCAHGCRQGSRRMLRAGAATLAPGVRGH